jgi:hypothetical protein
MQIILTETEYNNLKTVNNSQIKKIKDELFENNTKFIIELANHFKRNWTTNSYESGNFGKDADKIVEKYTRRERYTI